MIELIEPIPVWSYPLIWGWYEQSRRVASDDFGPKTINEFVELYGGRAQSGRVFGICINGQIGGVVEFEQATPALAIGHILFAPWFLRQRGASAAALKAACARLFETSGTVKILGLIPEDNRLAIAMCVRHGATVEGLLRHHTVRDGKPINAVAVGVTKEEFGGIERGTQLRWDKIKEHRNITAGLDLHAGTEQPSGLHPEFPPGVAAGSDLGRDQPERGGDPDIERRHNQQDLLGDRRPDAEVSGGPRLRAKRGVRKGATPNRTGKRVVARPKQRRSGQDAVGPEQHVA